MFIQQKENPNKYELIPRKAEDVKPKLDAGVYTITTVKTWSGMEIYLELNTRYRSGKEINTGVFKEAREHVDFFVDPIAFETRDELGMMHKLALIFNGGPGTGKTFLAGQIMEKLVREKDAICIMSKGEPRVDLHVLIDQIRTEDPDRFIGILIDEYEKCQGDELDMLSFLDGTNSRNNLLLIATVNSTKRLPETIINRIGRIERVYNFDTDDTDIITAMIDSVIPDTYKNILKAEAIALEFIEYGVKPSIDFITVIVRNKIYEYKSNKEAPLLLENIKKSKARKDKKKPVGFETPNDNRGELSKKQIEKEQEHTEMVIERSHLIENTLKAMGMPIIVGNN
jgi:KaiC/GvpD/RAD55 family RecA-like ATPase